jgi:GNAT superfamily N-acetyltransferase
MPFTITIDQLDKYDTYENIKIALKNDTEEHLGGGLASIIFDKSLTILRIDVDKDYRNQGYGSRLMLALCQKAFSDNVQHGAPSFTTELLPVYLIADEGESPGLRTYYEKMGFTQDEQQENDRPDQYSMTGKLGSVITNLQIILAAKYSNNAIRVNIE